MNFILFNVLFSFFIFSSLEAQNIIRYATSNDTLEIHNANIGDLIIAGGNETFKGVPAIYIHLKENWRIKPGKKILIKGGVYEWIVIENISSGTQKEPIVITNYNGQVETKEFVISGLIYFKLTGKYDYINKTGDSKYRGHLSGYAYSQGKYGIFVNNQWTSTERHLLSVNGVTDSKNVDHPCTNYEIEYVESGNGGYSNVFKWDNKVNIVDNVKIHDCYFHDIGGEGIYLGNTDWTRSQQIFRNLKFYNNRLLRCGLDGLQLNRIGENAKIFNNVIDGGMNWKAPFMEWQDFGCSLSFVNGNSFFKNNIIINGTGAFFQSNFRPESWYSKTASINGFISFDNNLFLTTKSSVGVYLGPDKEILKEVKVIITNNDFNKWKFRYNEVYPRFKNEETVIISFYKGNVTVSKNRWDGNEGKVDIYQSDNDENTKIENNRKGIINDVEFENYFGNGYNNVFLEMWAAMITVGEKNKKNVSYFTGQFVCHKSKIYRCIKENSNIMPGSHEDWKKYWVLQTFQGGKYTYPPDDIRLKPNNYHYLLNRGIIK